MQIFKKIIVFVLLYLVAGLLLIGSFLLLVYAFSTPKNDRDWTMDQTILPYAEFDGDMVTIRNIRNFSYTSVTEYIPNYYDKTFNLNELVSVDFIVEPLKPVAIAHTFMSFGFENGDHIALSVEIRKEKGEAFSPLRGLLDQFELMYVIADERDVMQLRALHRHDKLLLYPAIVTKEKMRELFVSMLMRANKLADEPEFYNTLTSTCTTNIVDHINAITERKVPWDFRVLFPLDSDEYAYELGLIDTSIPFTELRKKQEINEYVEKFANAPDFSIKIRQGMAGKLDTVTSTSTVEEVVIPDEILETKDVTKTTDSIPPQQPIAPKVVSKQSVFDTEGMLRAHNRVRANDSVPPLRWSETLSESAQKWSDTLKKENCVFRHDPNTSFGENIFWAWKTGTQNDALINTPDDVSTYWAEEKENYNYTKNTCTPGTQCGHYTQMVWSLTTEVGCGVSSCSENNKRTDVWVCRYNPAGNDGSRPF